MHWFHNVVRVLPGRPIDRLIAVGSLCLVLGLAAWLRVTGALHDLPFSFYGDELYLVKRAMAMGTGDLNPHWFHKPALMMYVLAGCYGLYFLAGAAIGAFPSIDAFGAHFLSDPGPFLLIGRLLVAVTGVGLVAVVGRIAHRAFRSVAAGIAAAATAAVLTPLVASSQDIKSDIPCAFLIALAVCFYLSGEDRASRRPLILSAVAGGLALGMHYYAVILLPAIGLAELLPVARRRVPLATATTRLALAAALFTGTFFVASPFNFIDPAATEYYASKVAHASGSDSGFEPDAAAIVKPGLATWAGAAVHLTRVLTRESHLGILLLVLFAAGMLATATNPDTRTLALFAALPFLAFAAAAVVVFPFHAAPRHLTAFLPLLSALTWPGARAIGSLLTRDRRVAAAVAGGLVAVACTTPLAASLEYTSALARPDSRVAAYQWAVRHISSETKVLVDDYGPILSPGPAAVARLRRRRDGLPPGPFVHHQERRLALLEQYPSATAFDVEELGHQWWLPSEKPDAELRTNRVDLDMGDPLISRSPEPLSHYTARGIQFVITNSDAAGRYRKFPERFPSFARFYQELSQLRPVATFDPAVWQGKGPVVWVYEIGGQHPHGTPYPAVR